MRTNGERQREEAKERGGKVEGEGTRETALAAQWEDYPMPGLVAAATAAWTGRSAPGEAEQQQQATGETAVQDPSKGFHFITDSHRKYRGTPRPAGTK